MRGRYSPRELVTHIQSGVEPPHSKTDHEYI
jgi:hypothetical protein